ncbi:hypothetical protein REPUB_Repub15cG0099200 [Reevesia pubescens]
MLAVEKKAVVTDGMDFDKLMPYSSLPKVWKIAHYDAESNRIMLTPVPEYPNASENKIDEEASELPDTSLYGEYSSLEIDYSFLIDVCLVKHGNSNTIIAVVDGSNENCAQNQYVLTSRGPNGSNEPVLLSVAPPAQGIVMLSVLNIKLHKPFFWPIRLCN